MRGYEPAQVEVADGVAAEHQKGRVPEEVQAVSDPSGSAEGSVLYAVAKVYATGRAVAEMLYDGRGVVAQRGADLRNAVRAEQLDSALHQRLTQKRHHGFGQLAGDGLESPALSAGHNYRFHVHIICAGA